MMPRLLCLQQKLLKVEMDEDKRLEMDVKLFLWRINKVVGELYLAFVIVAAALGIEMRRHGMMLVVFLAALGVTEALRMHWRTHSDVTRHRVARRAIMEAHVPSE